MDCRRLLCSRTLRTQLFWWAVCVLLAAIIWDLRAPTLSRDVFLNEDIAGITYNADLLRRGLMPGVDYMEVKAPASFFGTFLLWEMFGRSLRVMEIFGIVWSVIGALGVFVAGSTMYRPLCGLLAALIYALWQPVSDGMTINYNAWMITPYIWGIALLAVALRRRRLHWFFCAGLAMGLAGLLKRQGVLLPVMCLALLVALPTLDRRFRRPKSANVRRLLIFAAGGAAAFVPFALFYALHGGLWRFFEYYFLSSQGWSYAQSQFVEGAGLERLKDGLGGFVEFFGVPSLLATLTVSAILAKRRLNVSAQGWLLAAASLAGLIGVTMGLRFFKSYYSQILPCLALLAAHPEGPLAHLFAPATWSSVWRSWDGEETRSSVLAICARAGLAVMLFAACVPSMAAWDKWIEKSQRSRQQQPPRKGQVEHIGHHIAKHTHPNDKIWVWGWWGWPAYFYSDRISAARVFKSFGFLTSSLTGTWRRATRPVHFVPTPLAGQVIADLRRNRPAFIVVAQNESYTEWKAFAQLLVSRYEKVPEHSHNAVHLYKIRQTPTSTPAIPVPAAPVGPKGAL